MLVDYHVHLEEGPYNHKWAQRTVQALNYFNHNPYPQSSKSAAEFNIKALYERIYFGDYSEQWLDYYLQRAKQLDLKEVGIVDHLYRFRETKAYFEGAIDINDQTSIGKMQYSWLNNVATQSMDAFVTLIENAKKRWASEGVQLRLGIEADYFVGQETALKELLSDFPWDYVIGSVHFIDGWGFDNPDMQSRFEEFELKNLYTQFYETVEKMIQSKLFDFVAHLDNLKVFNYRVDDESFNEYWYEKIAGCLAKTNTATEINAGLFYRYPVKESCPAPSFLQKLIEFDVPITLSSDAHYPDDVGTRIAEHRQILLDAGVTQIATFKNRKRIMVDLQIISSISK